MPIYRVEYTTVRRFRQQKTSSVQADKRGKGKTVQIKTTTEPYADKSLSLSAFCCISRRSLSHVGTKEKSRHITHMPTAGRSPLNLREAFATPLLTLSKIFDKIYLHKTRKKGCRLETDYREAMKLQNQLCFPLYAAARSVVSLYTPVLKPLGLTYTQYIVFLVLWEQDGLTVGELCKRLTLDNGTLSPLLKKMQQAGYVERRRSGEDDRVVLITLTEEGRALQKKAKDVPAKVGTCIDLSPEKAQALYALLYELLDHQKKER